MARNELTEEDNDIPIIPFDKLETLLIESQGKSLAMIPPLLAEHTSDYNGLVSFIAKIRQHSTVPAFKTKLTRINTHIKKQYKLGGNESANSSQLESCSDSEVTV